MMGNGDPVVFVFDLDGTIVSDVSALICEWQILKAFGVKDSMKQYKRALGDSFDAGIVRPYFAKLIQAVATLPHKYIFVYTASEGQWARFLCSCLERHYKVTFDHVFTRAHCIKNNDTFELTKSIKRIYPRIVKHAQHKYNVTLSKDMKKHIVMIDNNYILPEQEQSMLLKCPSYTHDIAYDVLRFVPMTIANRHFLDIASMMLSYNIFPSKYHRSSFSQNHFWVIYYTHVADRFKALSKQVSSTRTDTYFKGLARAVRTLQHAPASHAPAASLLLALRNRSI